MSFKPMLAPNDKVEFTDMVYPLLASKKLDGIRCLIFKGQLLSRSLKQIQNKQLRARLEPLRLLSEQNELIFDGEIYSPKLTFQEITHFVMTQDLGDEALPDHLKFYCFDVVDEGMLLDIHFSVRVEKVREYIKNFSFAECLSQQVVENPRDVERLFEYVLNDGCEGLILRNPTGRYKTGRGTVKEGLIYKVKPFETFDAAITGVVQATQVNDGAEKKTNELGRSVTSKKKDDRHAIEKASAFWVKYKDLDLKVTLAMTDEEKEEVWQNRDKYIGKIIEYKGMLIGAKDLPRHPVFLRFRKDKD